MGIKLVDIPEFKRQFLAIIEERLHGENNLYMAVEREMRRGNNRDIVRRVDWHKATIETNLKIKGLLKHGSQFAHWSVKHNGDLK